MAVETSNFVLQIIINQRFMNSLPKYWAVKNDGSRLFAQTVRKYLYENYSTYYECNTLNTYYGYNGKNSGRGVISTPFSTSLELVGEDGTPVTILTIQQFIEMTTQQTMKEGDLVEVTNNKEAHWTERIYLGSFKNAHIVVSKLAENNYREGKYFRTEQYIFIRPIPVKLPIVIELIELSGQFVKIVEGEIRFGCTFQYSLKREKLQEILNAYDEYNKA